MQCIAVYCSVLQHVAVPHLQSALRIDMLIYYCANFLLLQCVTVCCSVLQCAAVCCSVLQCAAVPHLQSALRIDVLICYRADALYLNALLTHSYV